MDFLRAIFDKILALLPQVFILTPYENGVRFTFGGYYKSKEAGWYLVWPIIQRMVYMEVNSQIVDLKTQSIRTKDSHDVMISGAIQYSIRNIEKAILNIQDVDKAIATLALGIILEYVHIRTLEECGSVDGLKTEILKGIREEAKDWGMKIEKVFITDFGKTRNIRLLSDGVNTNVN